MTSVFYRSAVQLGAGTLTATLTQTSMPDLTQSYSIDYASLDPAALFNTDEYPPARSQFVINGVAVIDTKGTTSDPIVVNAGNPIIVEWQDTTRSTDRSTLRWRVQIKGATGDHEDIRSPWMSESSSYLTFNAGSVSWTAPNEFTQYLLNSYPGLAQLGIRVRDDGSLRGVSENVYFSVQSVSSNQVPVVTAGLNRLAGVNSTVEITATANDIDIDGAITDYAWTQTAGTTVTLNNANTDTVSFTAPASATTLTLRITVTDNGGETASDDININVISLIPL
jgi:hypothetical protein